MVFRINVQHKLIILLLLISLALLLSSCGPKTITKTEAIAKVQAFADSSFKFYSQAPQENGSVKNITEVRITVKDAYQDLETKDWDVLIHIESEVDGVLKQRDILIPVDPKTGEIRKDRMKQLSVKN